MLADLTFSYTAFLSQTDIIDRLNPNDILPLVAVALGILTGAAIALTSIISRTWRQVRERRMSTTLIQEMLDRNMSASEIHEVIDAWATGTVADTTVAGQNQLGHNQSGQGMPNRPPKPAKPMA